MKPTFRNFLRANLEPSMFHNGHYHEALVKYHKKGIKPKEEKLSLPGDYFEKSVIVVNSSEKELASRFENMLKRVEIFKSMEK